MLCKQLPEHSSDVSAPQSPSFVGFFPFFFFLSLWLNHGNCHFGDVKRGPQGGRLYVRTRIVAKFLSRRTLCPRFDKQNSSHVADC